jgi:hypothetical protein
MSANERVFAFKFADSFDQVYAPNRSVSRNSVGPLSLGSVSDVPELEPSEFGIELYQPWSVIRGLVTLNTSSFLE